MLEIGIIDFPNKLKATRKGGFFFLAQILNENDSHSHLGFFFFFFAPVQKVVVLQQWLPAPTTK